MGQSTWDARGTQVASAKASRSSHILFRGKRMLNGRRELGPRPPWMASRAAWVAASARAGPESPGRR